MHPLNLEELKDAQDDIVNLLTLSLMPHKHVSMPGLTN